MTIRDMVRAMQIELRDTEVAPERAREMLLKATALLGSCNEEIRVADAEFAGVLLECLDGEKSANRAKIRAETTSQYERKRTARDTKELVQETVRSLKYFLRSLEEEMRLAR